MIEHVWDETRQLAKLVRALAFLAPFKLGGNLAWTWICVTGLGNGVSMQTDGVCVYPTHLEGIAVSERPECRTASLLLLPSWLAGPRNDISIH